MSDLARKSPETIADGRRSRYYLLKPCIRPNFPEFSGEKNGVFEALKAPGNYSAMANCCC
jgi:hypothetical protein